MQSRALERKTLKVFIKNKMPNSTCVFLFAGLAVGLGIGAIAEVAKKSLKPQQGDERNVCVLLVT